MDKATVDTVITMVFRDYDELMQALSRIAECKKLYPDMAIRAELVDEAYYEKLANRYHLKHS